ncbi:hypothetical protein CN918_27420 [Priestia megaterium]|nr:hypothetical protein CN918_27420 [Priestia megaterium]
MLRDDMKKAIMEHNTTLALQYEQKEVEEPWETISLFHGTSTRYLNEILQKGILPRKYHQNDNFANINESSNEHVVYLTNKWHYSYAIVANNTSIEKEVGTELFRNSDIDYLWSLTGDFPMYVELNLPVELLGVDEDTVYQHTFMQKLRSEEIQVPSDIAIEDSLSQGTVVSLKPILPEYINNIVIIGSSEFRYKLLNGPYAQERSLWANGFGIGELSHEDISMDALMNHRGQLYYLDYAYPHTDNPIIEKIFVSEDGKIKVKTKDSTLNEK